MLVTSAPPEPIYIDWLITNRLDSAPSSQEESTQRIPVRPGIIWNEYDSIPSTPDPGLTADGNTVGVVTLRVRLPLTYVETTPLGAVHYATTPATLLSQAIPPSASGSAEGALAGAPSAGYTPVIEDKNGTVFESTSATWVIDGLNNVVVFPGGLPAGMTPPLAITFFRYTGETGGGGGDAGHVWLRAIDPVGGQYNIAPNPAFPTAASDYFVFPAASSEGTNSGGGVSHRMVFDTAKGAFRAGIATGTTWNSTNRGIGSVALGTNGLANGAQAVVLGAGGSASGISAVALGTNGTASGAYSTVMGRQCYATGEGSVAVGMTSVASGSYAFALGFSANVSGEAAASLGGSDNIARGLRSVVVGGTTNQTANSASNSLAAGYGSHASHAGTFVWSTPAAPRTSAFANEVTFGAEGGFRVLLGGTGLPAYNGGAMYVDGDSVVTGSLAAATLGASAVVLADSASVPVAPAAGQGTLWSSSASGRPQFSTGGGALYDLAGYIARVDDSVIGAGQKNITLDPAATTNGDFFVFPNVSTEGASTRMMFDTAKGAFRAGAAEVSQWNDADRGVNSVAFGRNCKASADYSFAVGDACSVDGQRSVCLGGPSTVFAGYSAVLGGSGHLISSGAASPTHVTVLGGENNTTGANVGHAVLAGKNSQALHSGTFVWSTPAAPHASAFANEVTFGAEGGFRVLLGGDGTPAYAGGVMYVDGDAVVTGSTTSSGPVFALAGAVDAPAYTFTADPDTGMYRTGTNSLGFALGGALALALGPTLSVVKTLATFENNVAMLGNVYGSDGGQSTPSYSFSSSTSSGMYYDATGTLLKFSIANNVALSMGVGALETGGDLLPTITDTYKLGDTAQLWTAVYANNGTIQTSDARMKNSVADLPADLGLSFVESLRPVTYKWNDTVNTDGDTGEVTTITHSRTHLGFIAQEVESAIAATGRTLSDVDLVDNDALVPGALPDATDRYCMRPAQFIPILIKAIQELTAANIALAARVTVLENP